MVVAAASVVVFGGGPAPGINAVIGSATIRAALSGVEVVGILDGFQWIMKNDLDHVRHLSIPDVSRIHFRGGSYLGISRANPTKDQVLRAYAAQFTVMENANALAAKAIRTCGGQAMLKSLSLERIYRDSRCGSLMLPWTAEICLDRLGRESLYEAGEKDE